MTPGSDDRLEDLLHRLLGPDAQFRPGQREAIETIAVDGARALVVQRTGWGKSLVYWIATRMRRDAGHGPTLLISPLLSLMRNQIAAAERIGVRAVTINSGNRDEWSNARQALRDGTCDVLLISPERLSNTEFTTEVLREITDSIGMFVIDEAHCISDWGHDFRPDYQRIRRILSLLPPTVPILATTATANDRVVDDVADQIGAGARIFRGPLVRDSLRLQVINLGDQAERLAWLVENLGRLPGSGIVYCLTVLDTERVSAWLNAHGFTTRPYSAKLATEERAELEASFLTGAVPILVATVALGMGFDKPDLGFVVHFQRPVSVIAYYQQVGRAGRAIDTAYGILLTGREDDEIADYFIDTAFPPAQHTEAIVSLLEADGPLTIRQIEREINLRHRRIEQALKLLEVDGAIAHDGGSYFRTPNPLAAENGPPGPDHRGPPARTGPDARVHDARRLSHGIPHSGS
jgi:ATP-dependent DNA helicase RecQ